MFKFDGDPPVPGLLTVLLQRGPHVATPWTIASWLTIRPQTSVGGRRPIDALRRGDVTPSVQASGQFAAALSRDADPDAPAAAGALHGFPSCAIDGFWHRAWLHDDPELHDTLDRQGVRVSDPANLPSA